MKFNKKFFILTVIILSGLWFLYSTLKPKTPEFKTVNVVRGDIIQEVSETGTVKKGENLNLSFKNSGMVDDIAVSKGDIVVAGQTLAQLDTTQLEVQLRQARANLDLYEVSRQKLINGATPEDISLARTAVANAQSARDNAQRALSDAQSNADQKLSNLYAAASDTITSAHAKAINAANSAAMVQRTYFTPQSEDSIRFTEVTREISWAAGLIEDDGNLSQSLRDAAVWLSSIAQNLGEIRSICENKAWRDVVAQTDKDELDTQRDYIIAAQTSVNTALQNINLQKVANDTAINAAQSALTAAEGAMQSATEQLAKVTASPRQEDIAVLDAQIEQAKAANELLQLQIADSKIIAPVAGQVAQINFKEGEAYIPMTAAGVVVLIPDDPYYVEVDIYEEDIAKIHEGNAAVITPASSVDNSYAGKVISVEPDSKIVNGVVYYTTRVAFEDVPPGVKSGMSADVVIVTANLNGVLLIPESALNKDGSEYIVRVLRGNTTEDAVVNIGIKSKGQVQIVSGLTEGDVVIIQ